VGRIVDAVFVQDQRMRKGSELDQPMPIGVVARQARDLEAVMDHGAESLGACPPLQYFGTQRLVGLQRG